MMDGKSSERFDTWAVVEVFGHQKLAGRISEQTIGGAGFIRVDVPETTRGAGFSRFYGPSAIYSITPTSEQAARLVAERLQPEAITVYVPKLRALPASADEPHEHDEGRDPWGDEDEEDA
jgi:hypothetical protein